MKTVVNKHGQLVKISLGDRFNHKFFAICRARYVKRLPDELFYPVHLLHCSICGKDYKAYGSLLSPLIYEI